MDLRSVARYGVADQTYAPDGLFAHNASSILAKGITLATGQNLARGTVLGQITSSGLFTAATSAASDGSQNPTAVLAEDTNATAANVNTIAYFEGTFAEQKLILGAGLTIATVRPALRSVGIYTDIIVPFTAS